MDTFILKILETAKKLKIDMQAYICYNKCRGGTQNGTKNVENVAGMEK